MTTITWIPRARAAAIAAIVRGRSECVLADQGPVEVAGEGPDVAREVVREDQPEVAWTTYAATSAICCSVSWPLKEGIGAFP